MKISGASSPSILGHLLCKFLKINGADEITSSAYLLVEEFIK
jgi:hypothetical protein